MHTFLCNEGVDDCSSPNFSIVYLKHLQLNHPVHTIDDTTVPFVGKVTVADTAMPGAGALGCPIIDAEVCLVDHQRRNEVDVQTVCTRTDAFGNYKLPAVLGTRVSPTVNYFDHVFEATTIENNRRFKEGIKIVPGEIFEGFNLYDVSKAVATVEVAGGLCNRFLGVATVQATIPGCDWEGQALTLQNFKQFFSVPAQTVNVELKTIIGRDGSDRFGIVDILRGAGKVSQTIDLTQLEEEDGVLASSEGGNIPDGAGSSQALDSSAGNETAIADALAQEEEEEQDRIDLKLYRFQFDGSDSLFVRVGKDLNETCFDDSADSFHTVETSQPVLLRVNAIQEFGFDIQTCDRFPENTLLTIRNNLGEDDNDVEFVESLSGREDFENIVSALRRCKPACKVPLVHIDGSSAHAVVPLFSGRPNHFDDLTKSIDIIIDRSATVHKVSWSWNGYVITPSAS